MKELKNRGDELTVTNFRVAPNTLKLRRVNGRPGRNHLFLFHDNRMENVGLVGLFTELIAYVDAGAAENTRDLINDGKLGPFDAFGLVFGGANHHVNTSHR